MCNVSEFEKREKFRQKGRKRTWKKYLSGKLHMFFWLAGAWRKARSMPVSGKSTWPSHFFHPLIRRASATTLRSNKPKGKCNKRGNLVRDRPHRGWDPGSQLPGCCCCCWGLANGLCASENQNKSGKRKHFKAYRKRNFKKTEHPKAEEQKKM